MARKTRLSIVTPVYNEADVIEEFHLRLNRVLKKIPKIDYTIIYVADRSTDNTIAILKNIVKRDKKTRALALSSRFGHQMSLFAGIENSINADAVIMMDSDLQHPPELIPKMIDAFLDGYEVVFTLRTKFSRTPVLRQALGKVFYAIFSYLSGIPIPNNSADFRLISRKIAQILVEKFPERNLFLRGIFPWIGFRQVGVTYAEAPRAGKGQSKYSLALMCRLALHGILAFSTKPLRIGIFLGLGFSLLSFAMIGWAVWAFFSRQSIPEGWTTLVVLQLLFSGIQLVVLGIIGTYLGGLCDEAKRRPRYLVEDDLRHE